MASFVDGKTDTSWCPYCTILGCQKKPFSLKDLLIKTQCISWEKWCFPIAIRNSLVYVFIVQNKICLLKSHSGSNLSVIKAMVSAGKDLHPCLLMLLPNSIFSCCRRFPSVSWDHLYYYITWISTTFIWISWKFVSSIPQEERASMPLRCIYRMHLSLGNGLPLLCQIQRKPQIPSLLIETVLQGVVNLQS